MKHLSIFVLILLLSPTARAGELPEQIPSLQKLIDLQFSCNSRELNRMGWARERVFGHLTSKSWSVVSNLKVQELKSADGSPRSRRFEVTFKGWDAIYCVHGQPKKLAASLPVSKSLILELSQSDAKADPGLVLDLDPQSAEDNGPFMRFLITEPEGEDPAVDDANSLACLIDKDDFLQGKAQINLEQLCAGQSAPVSRETESYLRWLRKALK